MAKAKILVAEDEAILRKPILEKLGKLGYEVFGAEDGQQALELARKERPEVIILDILMPKIDGIEVCKTIKQDDYLKDTVIIIWSAKTELYDKRQGIQAGADVYLTKPARLKELVDTIERFVKPEK